MSDIDLTKLVFFDLETTGLDWAQHQILEIGVAVAKKASKIRLVRSWSLKIAYRGGAVDPEAAEINGFDRDTWRQDADRELVIRRAFDELATAAQIWAHGVVFDWGFLTDEFRHFGLSADLGKRTRDTRTLVEPLVWTGKIETPSLHEACRYFGISNKGAHAAEVDAIRAFRVYRAMHNYLAETLR